MSPSSREKQYARRRYEKWQERRETRMAHQRALRRRALLAVGAVVATLAVVGVVTVFAKSPSDSTTTAAATPSAGAATPSADTSNPCGQPPDAQPSKATYDGAPPASLAESRTWTLALDTSCGPLRIELDGAKAPKAVASTIFLVRKGFYDNTRCHRITTEGIYVLQCGDPLATGSGGPGYSYGPVENAPADNVYPAGTVAMARQGGKGDSMGSQFFLVYKDSTIPSDSAGGYSVIGKIVGGLDVVEKVAAGGVQGGGTDGPPTRAIAITGATVG